MMRVDSVDPWLESSGLGMVVAAGILPGATASHNGTTAVGASDMLISRGASADGKGASHDTARLYHALHTIRRIHPQGTV